MTTKPTAEQRTIINAAKWCRRQSRRCHDSQYVFDSIAGHAYARTAHYLNSKLPKELRVKL